MHATALGKQNLRDAFPKDKLELNIFFWNPVKDLRFKWYMYPRVKVWLCFACTVITFLWLKVDPNRIVSYMYMYNRNCIKTFLIHLGRFIFDSSWGSASVPWTPSLWQKKTCYHVDYCRQLHHLLWCQQMRKMMNKYSYIMIMNTVEPCYPVTSKPPKSTCIYKVIFADSIVYISQLEIHLHFLNFFFEKKKQQNKTVALARHFKKIII